MLRRTDVEDRGQYRDSRPITIRPLRFGSHPSNRSGPAGSWGALPRASRFALGSIPPSQHAHPMRSQWATGSSSFERPECYRAPRPHENAGSRAALRGPSRAAP